MIENIKKRNSELVPFNIDKISGAVFHAMQAAQEGSEHEAKNLATEVERELGAIKRQFKSFIPDVEGIQDIVERILIVSRHVKTAKAFILYREQRATLRKNLLKVSSTYQKLANDSKKYFDSIYSEFIYLRTYARWIDEEGRRETWIETVDRYVNFMREHLGEKLSLVEYAEVREAILTQSVMPSMRLMQFAGAAANSTNVCAYNCAFIAPTCIRDFAESLYILMCGTGLGFSVEDQCIQQLPQIKNQSGVTRPKLVIGDSREGWAEALRLGMEAWYEGEDIEFDFTQLRAAGERLKTFGGRSSGPAPLQELLTFTKQKILKRQGSRLNSLDAHDILTKLGLVVVTGGVRRSAELSLSDLHDSVMREAKQGYFYYTEPQRSVANNSAVYKEKPSNLELLSEWMALIKSGAGERGIFNRGGLMKTLPRRRIEYLMSQGDIINGKVVGIIGLNPCAEILLRGTGQFCNLSEVVCRADDTEQSLLKKIEIATLLGTFQSTLTNFEYLSEKWAQNCRDERLLGVSLTGQWDCAAVRSESVLSKLREQAINVNASFAQRFGINPSTAITAVKPSGNVSQLVNCASGMHARFSPYYIRRVRISAADSLLHMLKDQGITMQPEVGQTPDSATTFVLEFPVKSPPGSIYNDSQSALDQLEYWKIVKIHYTEHNPSITVYVADHEWIEVCNWININWDYIGGISFLPKNETIYQLAPYEKISEQKYLSMTEALRKLDLSRLPLYESEDRTEQKKELACSGNSCEL